VLSQSLLADTESSLSKAHGGSDSVIRLSALIQSYSKQVKTEAEQERLSSLAADLSQISARFLARAQFVAMPSAPERPERPERPRPLTVAVLGAMLAALLSAILLWRKEWMAALWARPSENSSVMK